MLKPPGCERKCSTRIVLSKASVSARPENRATPTRLPSASSLKVRLAGFGVIVSDEFEQMLVMALARQEHHPMLAELDRLPVAVGGDVADAVDRHFRRLARDFFARIGRYPTGARTAPEGRVRWDGYAPSARVAGFRRGSIAQRKLRRISSSLIRDVGGTSVTSMNIWQINGTLFGEGSKTSKNLSGIACRKGKGFPRECLVIDDELQSAQFVKLKDGEINAGDRVELTTGLELDGEGIAYSDGFYYVIGSHGYPRRPDKKADVEALEQSDPVERARRSRRGSPPVAGSFASRKTARSSRSARNFATC